jgi:hypothetical protein
MATKKTTKKQVQQQVKTKLISVGLRLPHGYELVKRKKK